MSLPRITPIQPTWRKDAFDHPDWLFDIKFDGFRGVCYIERGRNRLISHNGGIAAMQAAATAGRSRSRHQSRDYDDQPSGATGSASACHTAAAMMRRHGKTPIEWLSEIGVFAANADHWPGNFSGPGHHHPPGRELVLVV